jgi:uncharacterized protein
VDFFNLVSQNLLSPMVLFFILGAAAALASSDLNVPEPIARLLSLYLLMSIGFKGGAEVAHNGFTLKLIATIGLGVLLSALIPVLAYAILRKTTKLSALDAAAVAGHYGSISAVTFAAITNTLTQMSIPFEGYMAAVAAAMEAPAIFSALTIAQRGAAHHAASKSSLLRDIALNGAIVMLFGSFIIGTVTGTQGLTMLKAFIVDPYAGFLCLFLLDIGLLAGKGLKKGWKNLAAPVIAFGTIMPLIGATIAAILAHLIGLSEGGTAVMMTLAASASYIAVPAAMRLALPDANLSIALTLSLGITFPFNLTLGIPLYLTIASHLAR